MPWALVIRIWDVPSFHLNWVVGSMREWSVNNNNNFMRSFDPKKRIK